MAKITQNVRNFVEKERDPALIFVGTSSKKGVPNVSVKGTFIYVVDDDNIAFANVYPGKTVENVKENPNISVAMINSKNYKGYQIKGAGEIVTGGPLLTEARKQNPQINSVTKVKVQEVYVLDYGPTAGQKA